MKNITFEIKYICLECGHIFKEKHLKKKETDPLKCPKCESPYFTLQTLKINRKKP